MPAGSSDYRLRKRPTSSDQTVLVVSPDAAWNDALRRRLTPWSDTAGIAVLTTADSGRAAVYFDRLRPAVVVLDAVALDAKAMDLLIRRAAPHATVLAAGPAPSEPAYGFSVRRIAHTVRAAASAVQHAVRERLD